MSFTFMPTKPRYMCPALPDPITQLHITEDYILATVKDLGVTQDANLPLKLHISLCSATWGNIPNMRHMILLQGTELVHAFITTRLDYYIVLLGGCPAVCPNQLQLVHDAAVCVLTRKIKFDSGLNQFTRASRYISQRLQLKAFNGRALACLNDLLKHYNSPRPLCSAEAALPQMLKFFQRKVIFYIANTFWRDRC